MFVFRSRAEAGMVLAHRLGELGGARAVVLGLPRGGVIVAEAVAQALSAPLDFIACRKLGAPDNPEFALGAIAEGDVTVLNDDELEAGGSPDRMRDYLFREAGRQREELRRQVALYRGSAPPVSLVGATAVLVDDGIATGLTMLAAVLSARQRRAARVVVAVPVAPPGAVLRFSRVADQVTIVECPSPFHAVGRFYLDFDQVSDTDVAQALARGKARPEG